MRDGWDGRFMESGVRRFTWESTVEWLFSSVAPHVSPQGVSAGMVGIDPATVFPFAGVFLLSLADVDFVNVGDENVHVAEVSDGAVAPFADRDLFEVIVVLGRCLAGGWGVGDITRGVGGDVEIFGQRLDLGLGGRSMGGRSEFLAFGGRHEMRVGVVGQGAEAGFAVFELDVFGELARGVGGKRGAG